MPAPTVTSITPSISGASGGAAVTLTGTNFTGTTGVTFGGMAASSVVVVSDTTLTCVTPMHAAGVASVLVTNADGTNGANALFFYIPSVPTDTHIYLKGGRGDGFVPLWIGGHEQPEEEETDEQSEPYRNEFQTTISTQNSGASFATGFGGQITSPAHITEFNVDTSIYEGMVVATPTYGALSDSMAGTAPRQFSKAVTWLKFASANGLVYKFRKADVIGWGSQRRDA